eukprot:GHVR01071087.1.p2 GENE.GHVR01071087.1~~GHVR01071087.1.p2  ORF type:complete len:170 (-),score=30.07 GHVR01071087.1:689-1150(-)
MIEAYSPADWTFHEKWNPHRPCIPNVQCLSRRRSTISLNFCKMFESNKVDVENMEVLAGTPLSIMLPAVNTAVRPRKAWGLEFPSKPEVAAEAIISSSVPLAIDTHGRSIQSKKCLFNVKLPAIYKEAPTLNLGRGGEESPLPGAAARKIKEM